jgi:hypothetical protein
MSLALSWRIFADYSVDELFPISSIGRLPEARENRFSTEVRAKFQQGNLKIYIQGLCHHYSLFVEAHYFMRNHTHGSEFPLFSLRMTGLEHRSLKLHVCGSHNGKGCSWSCHRYDFS